MDRNTLRDNLQRLSALSFLEEHLFDCVPHVFAGNRAGYVAWKRALGGRIDVDPACLTVVGSAAVGCSLNPSKNLKPFDAGSDVDVAVVSNYHFTVGWRYLRLNGTRRLSLDQKNAKRVGRACDAVHLLGNHSYRQAARRAAIRACLAPSYERYCPVGTNQRERCQSKDLRGLRSFARLPDPIR